ncbi:uncharacterized protein LOC111083416 [Limulus polyphemus]|uniref:Uncharacterized protein LOC111083416 n=1 Tax=Limulus polyphemus TaxID=6850 RepID=A0ABM1RW78_LIMPO|nr:uncharacterized protein LOC111083416 [Limulus polyphemus]
MENNTRRFVTDEQHEMFYRAQVQNRVYKREIVELDREIVKLQVMMNTKESSGVSDNELNDIFFTNVQMNFPHSPNSALLIQANKRESSESDVSQPQRRENAKGGFKRQSIQISKMCTPEEQVHQKRSSCLNQDITVGSYPSSVYSLEESLPQNKHQRRSGHLNDGVNHVLCFSNYTSDFMSSQVDNRVNGSPSSSDTIGDDTWTTAPPNFSLLSSSDDCFESTKETFAEINVSHDVGSTSRPFSDTEGWGRNPQTAS